MPSVSKKQHNLMAAVANNPAFAKKAGIPQSVGSEFIKADKGKKFVKGGDMKKLPPFMGKETKAEEAKEMKIKAKSPVMYRMGEKAEGVHGKSGMEKVPPRPPVKSSSGYGAPPYRPGEDGRGLPPAQKPSRPTGVGVPPRTPVPPRKTPPQAVVKKPMAYGAGGWANNPANAEAIGKAKADIIAKKSAGMEAAYNRDVAKSQARQLANPANNPAAQARRDTKMAAYTAERAPAARMERKLARPAYQSILDVRAARKAFEPVQAARQAKPTVTAGNRQTGVGVPPLTHLKKGGCVKKNKGGGVEAHGKTKGRYI